MNFRIIIEMLVKYLPDLIECLSRMPNERRTRLLSMLEDDRARSLLLRLLEREANSEELQSLLAELAKSAK
ncbi:hypothetical protein [Allorhodopirellula solitaria]|jgi:hypothetical protein|uniref:Uncharacterized protein n=1 Tax=Allorhodopirellula solitaria TaxID=2527987 RepID=A0A5C5YJ25_9BACT|nr:hypothetical protein [Allorhodopirellula solitaria]TWT74859.1 hypothetical protein CA85_01450 [Allorhodopirellula solitaria]